MANIIDNTYFIGEIALPHDEDYNDYIDIMIPIVEKEVLRSLLGDTVYTEYLADPSAEKFDKLINGHTYSYGDYKVIWDGIKGVAGKSMLAYFTYERILRDSADNVVSNGVVIQKSEKGETGSVNGRMCYANNRGVEIYGSTSNEWFKPTAYNFLKDSEYTFDNLIFTEKKPSNIFGI